MRIDPACRMTARAIRNEASRAPLIQDGLGKDAARGVAGAEDQDLVRPRIAH